MVSDFFATTVDDWTDPSGQLHAYLVPNADGLARLAPAVAAVSGLAYLAPQPIEALHATILRFPFLVSELDDDALARLADAASRLGAVLPPVELTFDEPAPVVNSVLTRATPGPPWTELIRVVRGAAVQAFGEKAGHYDPPFGPHITVAYATGPGEDEEIAAALAADPAASAPIGPLVFPSIAWCAVHQNRAAGTYTFETLVTTPLGG